MALCRYESLLIRVDGRILMDQYALELTSVVGKPSRVKVDLWIVEGGPEFNPRLYVGKELLVELVPRGWPLPSADAPAMFSVSGKIVAHSVNASTNETSSISFTVEESPKPVDE